VRREGHEFSGDRGGGGEGEGDDDFGGGWGEEGLRAIISPAAGKRIVNTNFWEWDMLRLVDMGGSWVMS